MSGGVILLSQPVCGESFSKVRSTGRDFYLTSIHSTTILLRTVTRLVIMVHTESHNFSLLDPSTIWITPYGALELFYMKNIATCHIIIRCSIYFTT